MSAPDVFALGGRQDNDERIISLFHQWIEAARRYHVACDGDEQSADDQWAAAVEDEIDECSANTAAGLAIKVFVHIRPEFNGMWAPLPYIRISPDEPPQPLGEMYSS